MSQEKPSDFSDLIPLASACLAGLTALIPLATEYLEQSLGKQPQNAPQKPPKKDREAMAIALIFEVGPYPSRIAERLGVPRTTLYGWKNFQDAIGRVKGKRTGRRGFVTEDGGLEAYADE